MAHQKLRLSSLINSMPQGKPKTYVRITRLLGDRFVEFDFAIGDASLYVELVLPREDFRLFCEKNHAIIMSDEQIKQVEKDKLCWRYGEDYMAAELTLEHESQAVSQQL